MGIFFLDTSSTIKTHQRFSVCRMRNGCCISVIPNLSYRADSARLVQCFSTLCRLYLIKIVFRIFGGGYSVVVKFIILMEGVT